MDVEIENKGHEGTSRQHTTQEYSMVGGGGGKHHFLFMVLFIYGAPSTLAIEGKPGRTSCQQSNTPCGGIQMFVLPATRIKQRSNAALGLV